MSLSIKHAESAVAKGGTEFERWKAKTDEEWFRPVVRTQLAVFLRTLPPDVKQKYATEIKNLEETIGLDQPTGGKLNAKRTSEVSWKPRGIDQLQPLPAPEPGPIGPLRQG